MPRYKGRNHFVVRHDLASFQALPGFIWNSGALPPPHTPPIGFPQVQRGDRWIGFAYTTGGAREKKASLVTGFYESISRAPRYGLLTPKARASAHRKKRAWLVKGTPIGPLLTDPVLIPPLSSFLGENLFNRRTITRISKKQFAEIQTYTRNHKFSPEKIPGLKRDPRNEQEVLAIVASNPLEIGITKIIRAQTRFPDMLVKLKGKAEDVHLELELYSSSFLNHGHERQVRACKFKGDGKSVGVLCWIDDDKTGKVRKHVHRIYELRDLLKNGNVIRW